MNYVTDIRGDLIFEGFEPEAIGPPHPNEHDLNLSSDHVQEMEAEGVHDVVEEI